MHANDVIEAYVADVCGRLARDQRDDVARELRALLHEELQGRARDAGRAADEVLALAMVRAFGDPVDVAARYRPTLTIIDPADGHQFLKWSATGLVVIWVTGLFVHFSAPADPPLDFLQRLGRWWGDQLIPSLWWPGVLTVWFGLAARSRRRRAPQATGWKPPAQAGTRVNRGLMSLALFGAALGIFILIEPRWILDVFWGGRAAPEAYEALTYTDTFRRVQAPWLLVLLLLQLPLFVASVSSGRRPRVMQRVELELSAVTFAVLAWTTLSGPVLRSAVSDLVAKQMLGAVALMVLIDLGVRYRRRLRPAPTP